MTMRMFYVDDSGSSQHGLHVFGWIDLAVESWNSVLADWLEWRHRLYRSTGVPADY